MIKLMAKQLQLLKKQPLSHGGELRKAREGRGARPLATRSTMHLVLRSSKAKAEWSMKKHDRHIRRIVGKFAQKYGVKVYALANVGNHLHFQIKLARRQSWKPFIRAITAAIAMAVTGASRWKKPQRKGNFWDYRPFTRVVQSWQGFLKLKDNILINQLEGGGHKRQVARWILKDAAAAGRISSA